MSDKKLAETRPARQIEIPQEMEELMYHFAVNVLTHNPTDLVDYAANYFTRLRTTRDEASSVQQPHTSSPEAGVRPPQVRGNPAETRINPKEMPRMSRTEVPTEKINKNLGTRRGRRISVCGERFDPEVDDNYEVERYEKTVEQRDKIREHVAGVFLFNVLEEADMEAVIDAMMPRPVEKGEVVISEGDDGDYCYVIEKGSYDVFISQMGRNEYIKTYEDRGCFGELALLYNMPRAATITATSDGFLWAVSRPTFRKLVVKQAHDKRQNYIRLLSTVPELKPLGHYEKMVLCDALTPVSCQPGQVIFRQGDQASGMYFIVDGKVVITDDRTDEKVDELSKGQYFGELALVKKQPRAATATASTSAKLAFLDLQAFERLLGPCMSILQSHIDAYEEIKK